MILTRYDSSIHDPLEPNLAFDPEFEELALIERQIIHFDELRVVVDLNRVSGDLSQGKFKPDPEGRNLWISYYSSTATCDQSVSAIKVAVADYLDAHYLDAVGIEFVDDNMDTKKFAELVHGFITEERLDPFLKMQWQPFRSKRGIGFLFYPKR